MLIDKTELRRVVLERRSGQDEMARVEKSGAICSRLIDFLQENPMSAEQDTLFTFLPFGDEADVRPVLAWCWSQGIRTAAPRTLREPREMRLYLIGRDSRLVPGPWGILEPSCEEAPAELERIGTVIVPGVAFDRNGGRLGYGGGYYDRFFASLRERGLRPLKVAPAFDLQMIDEVPMEGHDERMDWIVTETAKWTRTL